MHLTPPTDQLEPPFCFRHCSTTMSLLPGFNFVIRTRPAIKLAPPHCLRPHPESPTCESGNKPGCKNFPTSQLRFGVETANNYWTGTVTCQLHRQGPKRAINLQRLGREQFPAGVRPSMPQLHQDGLPGYILHQDRPARLKTVGCGCRPPRMPHCSKLRRARSTSIPHLSSLVVFVHVPG